MAAKDREQAPEPQVIPYITYPSKGGTKACDAGDLELDFLEGMVTLPDGKTEKMSLALKGTKFQVVYVTVNSSQRAQVSLDNGGYWEVAANQIQTFLWQPCKHATIHLAQASNIRVFASVDPRGGPAVADVTAPAPI
jgi:hypothetical protein